ncbi:MAG: hypothetical protein AAF430_20870 [Myxococcota bacterium]
MVSAVACVLAPGLSHAGAWVPEPGSGYHKVSVNHFRSDDFFGSRPGFEEFRSTGVTYYGEVGVLPRLALFSSVPITRLRQVQDGTRTESSGVADVDVGARVNLLEEPVVLSAAFLFKAPYFYDEDARLPRGNGQEDYEPRLLLGKSLGRFGYFGLEAAYRFRADDPSDEFRYLVEYGVGLGENLYFRSKLDGIQSIENADVDSQVPGNPALNPEFDLGRLELTTGWNFGSPQKGKGRWGMEFTYTPDLYGDNTLRGQRFEFGVTFSH